MTTIAIVEMEHPGQHWSNLYEELWNIIINTQFDSKRTKSIIGTDVQICCHNGKISFHLDMLRKLTNILDFAPGDELPGLATNSTFTSLHSLKNDGFARGQIHDPFLGMTMFSFVPSSI